MTFPSINSMNNTGMILDLIAKKQKVLGENLSNVDTPGYSRKDINFGQCLNSTGSGLETQMCKKLGSSPIFEEKTGEVVNAGNELMELQKNSLLYTMATRQMSSIITQMKTVINVGK